MIRIENNILYDIVTKFEIKDESKVFDKWGKQITDLKRTAGITNDKYAGMVLAYCGTESKKIYTPIKILNGMDYIYKKLGGKKYGR